MSLIILFSAIVIFSCIITNKFSNKLGMPALVFFMFLGIIFGSDGLLKLSFDDYELTSKLCSVGLLFIIFYIPLLLEDESVLSKEWLEDILKVRSIYPQGTIVRVNANGPLKHLVNYVGKERACDRAFLETEDMFTNIMLPDIYAGLISSGKTQLADTLKPYVGRLRCMYPDYNCPTPCGHARIRRKF